MAGIWAVRAMAGAPVGLAWGLAIVGAGLRWGTLGAGDLAVATRVAGPTLVAGPIALKAAMALTFAAAVVGEAQGAGLRSRAWGERAAAMAALACLAPLYLASGPDGSIGATAALWAAPAAALTAVVLFSRAWLAAVPRWVPDVAAGVGVAAALVIA